jgi:hypothetical protein
MLTAGRIAAKPSHYSCTGQAEFIEEIYNDHFQACARTDLRSTVWIHPIRLPKILGNRVVLAIQPINGKSKNGCEIPATLCAPMHLKTVRFMDNLSVIFTIRPLDALQWQEIINLSRSYPTNDAVELISGYALC